MPMSPRLLRPRATGFNPKSITGLALWLDASDAATLFQDAAATTPATATSDPVGAWLDKSGNARHATQSTAGSRPVVGSVNSRRAVNFDGTDDTLAYLQGLTSNDLTTFCVYRYDTLNNGVVFDYGYTGDNTNASNAGATGFLNSIGLQVNTVGTINTRLDSTRDGVGVSAGLGNEPGTLASLAGTTAIHTAAASFSASTTRYAANAGASLSNTGLRFNGSVWSLLSLGSRRNSGTPGTASVFMDGQICEFLMYERNLPQSQRRRIEQYLAARWGITLAPQVSNADAQDWINRVYANGGTVSSSTAAAVNQFCDDIDYGVGGVSIRDRFRRLNLFCGTGLNACLTPLYRAASLGDTQLGNATDTNVGGLFVSGNYNETGASGGLAGNGSNKYLNTGFPTNTLSASDRHLAAYPITWPNGAFQTFLGSESAAGPGQQQFALGHFDNADKGSFSFGPTSGSYLNNTTSISSGGMWIGVNTSGSGTIYRNGVANGTLSLTAATPTAAEIYAFAVNRNGGGANYFNGRIGGYSIGLSMTAAQAAAYNTAMQAFQTALTRNV